MTQRRDDDGMESAFLVGFGLTRFRCSRSFVAVVVSIMFGIKNDDPRAHQLFKGISHDIFVLWTGKIECTHASHNLQPIRWKKSVTSIRD